jgi:signal transduction histidine kinase
MTALFKDGAGGPRFSLSEIQVYSGNHNVARGAAVTRTPDLFPSSRLWPVSLLVDGYTSYGRLMELPEWLQSWNLRRILERKIKELDAREVVLAARARRRALTFGSGTVLLCLGAAVCFGFATRFRIQRELQNVRGRLARDIHDHIGSNLAGIAVLSEVARDHHSPDAAQREDWSEVNQIARETLDVMREVIWLIGDKKGAELDLMTQMQLAASRMLAGRKFVWEATAAEIPAALSLEARRDIFLFFKEALTNIVRHSEATRIELSARCSANQFQLSVVDNGHGFDPRTVRAGIGLNSQRLRAQALGGTVKIVSEPGRGATVHLSVPVGKMRRHLRFINRWHYS